MVLLIVAAVLAGWWRKGCEEEVSYSEPLKCDANSKPLAKFKENHLQLTPNLPTSPTLRGRRTGVSDVIVVPATQQ